MTDVSRVLAALDTVRDPELDEPVTELGFVSSCTVSGGEARVRLRLPTYFCAPNFAYLMVADAYDAVRALPGIESVEVLLDDHFASAEINAGVSAGAGFAESFPGLAAGELDELRAAFRRKAHLAAQERVARGVGAPIEDLVRLRLADPPPSADLDRLIRRRRELGLPAGPDASLLVDEQGHALSEAEAARLLPMARTVRVNIEANAGVCRGLLASRYGQQQHSDG
ncbi:MAG: iron-sulfur cluster assembly protein [Nocardioidaceae bacterium]